MHVSQELTRNGFPGKFGIGQPLARTMTNDAEMNTGWALPPGQRSLADQDVHVWLIALDEAPWTLKECYAIMSQDEQERAAKFKFDQDRWRYVIAHTSLRRILSGYLGVRPSTLKFSTGPNGKPYLALNPQALPIQFNLSHSNKVALLAVTLGREIGVDVEYVRQDFPFDEIAARFFTAREVAAIRKLPEHLRPEAFYKCWTSKEAFLKAKGIGLSGKLDEVNVFLAGDRHVGVEGTIAGWTLAEVKLNSDYMAAVVVSGSQCKVRCYRFG
jgi:4'-phosphopantetheinyl transferase